MAQDPRKYKTGNTVPSDNPRDFSDNALILDTIINSTSGDGVVNRLGNPVLKTINQFNTESQTLIDGLEDQLAKKRGWFLNGNQLYVRDLQGNIVPNGKLYTYEVGTTTNKATYQESSLTTPNTTPVILDTNGSADIYLDSAYTMVLKDSNDNELWTSDFVSSEGYKGLWPDTGGSAEKGDTYQTQVGGTPTGEYYTALQNTSVDPVGDNVNWKRNVSEVGVNDGDSQLAGGHIWPLSSQDSLSLGAQSTVVSINADRFRVNTGSGVGLLYLWEESGTLPTAPFTITNIVYDSDISEYTFTIGVSDYVFLTSVMLGHRESNGFRGWGAVGDNTKNNQSSFTEFCDYVHLNQRNGEIFNGSYLIEGDGYTVDTDTLNRGLAIDGGDRENSRLYFTPNLITDALIKSYKTSVGAGTYGNAVKNLSLFGTTAAAPYQGIAIDYQRAIYSNIQDVYIQFFDIGMRLDECFGSKYSDIQIWNCRENLLVNISQNNAMNFNNIQLYNSTELGARITGTASVTFNGAVIEGNPVGVRCQGINRGVSFVDGYTEGNDVHFEVQGGTRSFTSKRMLIRMNDGDSAFKPVNTNTASLLVLKSYNNVFRTSLENTTVHCFDLSQISGTDTIRLDVREPEFDNRAGSTLIVWSDGNAAIEPPSSIFEYSDYPIRDWADGDITFINSSCTIEENVTLKPDLNRRMKMSGALLINSAFFSASSGWRVEFNLGTGMEATRKTIEYIAAYTGTLADTEEGRIEIDTTGLVRIVFPNDPAGKRVNLDNIFYNRK